MNESEDQEIDEYESIIQKLEAEVRSHIRIEQQQRLHIEALQQRLEELQQECDLNTQKYELRIQQLEQQIDKKDHIVIGKVQNLNQTNFIIENAKKRQSPSALERLNQLAARKQQQKSKTSTTDQQMQALLKVYHDRDSSNCKSRKQLVQKQESKPQDDLMKFLESRQNRQQAFFTHRDDSSSIEKIRRTINNKLKGSMLNGSQLESELMKSSSFDGIKHIRNSSNKNSKQSGVKRKMH